MLAKCPSFNNLTLALSLHLRVSVKDVTVMSIETRMAIEQSRAMPQCSEDRVSVRYETKVFSHWDREALAEVARAFTYEIAWIPERQCWRSFLCSVSKLG
jgi:hypothetical protein